MQKKIPGRKITPTQTHSYKAMPGLSNWLVKASKYQKIAPISFKPTPIAKIKPQDPNSMDAMQRTLDATKKNGYRGANFIK